jgi:hypothetical protein
MVVVTGSSSVFTPVYLYAYIHKRYVCMKKRGTHRVSTRIPATVDLVPELEPAPVPAAAGAGEPIFPES